MHAFDYHRPSSLNEALDLIRGGGDAKVLAGGQSLLPAMKHEMAAPGALVSLRDVAELRGIRMDGGVLRVGAMATHQEVADSATVRETIPALADMAAAIGDAQVRNCGTLGGSVAHADPSADYPAALVALRATVETDRRKISADEFFTGMFATALEPDELVVAVHFPVPDRAAYSKFRSPASKYAIVGVMVATGPAGVRVAVTGAAFSVFRQTEMEAALQSSFTPEALDGITQGADGLVSDVEASAAYRAHLVGVMARRAVAECR